MHNLILIYGPQACGKMTIAQDVSRKTKFGLIHSHMIIEMMKSMFGYGTKAFQDVRNGVVSYLVESAFINETNLILTRTLNFIDGNDIVYFETLKNTIQSHGAQLYLIELSAELSVRLYRNKTENRLKHKPSKTNINLSEERLIEASKTYAYSMPEVLKSGFPYKYIDNSLLQVEEASKIIIEFVNGE